MAKGIPRNNTMVKRTARNDKRKWAEDLSSPAERTAQKQNKRIIQDNEKTKQSFSCKRIPDLIQIRSSSHSNDR